MQYHLIIVGCGGTGSVFLEKLTRYLSVADLKPYAEIILFDGDTVEEKNLRNQSFVKEDIGEYKSVVWANLMNEYISDRIVESNISYIEKRSDIERAMYAYLLDDDDIVMLFGCCDNHGCRLVMEDYFYHSKHPNILYFDSANEFDNGETVYAAKISNKVISPPRSVVFPDILKGDLRSVREMSCEELNSVSPQHMLINQLAAMQLLMGFVNVVENKQIPTGTTLFSSRNYTTQHFPTSFGKEGRR